MPTKEYYAKNREKVLEKKKEYNKAYAAARKDIWRARAYSTRYNITVEDYNTILIKQGGVCAICFLPETMKHSLSKLLQRLTIDHDHTTGIVRGLLCNKCNVALGQYEKFKALAPMFEAYLQKEGTNA